MSLLDCPFRKPNEDGDSDCREEKCALWMEDVEECAILSMGESLLAVVRFMGQKVEKRKK